MSTNIQIANTILDQLGGNKFIAMTGANNLVAINKGLQFKLPANFAKNKINCVQVILDPSDTYTMKFIQLKKYDVKVLIKIEGVFFDQLQEFFKEKTGLDTRL